MLVCLVLAFSLGAVSAEWNYPEGLGGGWSGLCATGGMQSPIDLSNSMKPFIHAPITFRNYYNGDYNKHYVGKLENNGRTVVWYVNKWSKEHLMGGPKWRWRCPSVRDGPYGGITHTHAYYLWKIEFHWGDVGMDDHGSEHTIDGVKYPLEMHMIHVEDEYVNEQGVINFAKAAADPRGFTVLAVLFNVDNEKPQNQEPLSTIDDEVWEFHHHHGGHDGKGGHHWDHDKRSRGKRDSGPSEMDLADHDHELNMRGLHFGLNELTEVKRQKREAKLEEVKLRLNPGAFIKKALQNGYDKTMSTYWTYKGSLTTPGCFEAVTWVVFQRPLPVAQVQVNAFASLYPNNYRMTKNTTIDHDVHMLIHDSLDRKCNNGPPFKKFHWGG